MRTATIERKTQETNIVLTLALDGEGRMELRTPIPFFNHMLSHLVKHSLFDLSLEASGDTGIDHHHTVEDVGIALGEALREALGDKSGIRRYSAQALPMDEVLVLVALDISGRGLLEFRVDFSAQRIGDFESGLVKEFLRALAVNAGLTLHVRSLSGGNAHHQAEAIFKALGLALREAVELDPRRKGVPSTKGTL